MNEIVNLNGPIIAHIPFLDIVLYLTPFSIALVGVIVAFTVFLALSKPELRTVTRFGEDIIRTTTVDDKEARFRRFMTIFCGVALIGVVTTGDLFDFALFVSLTGMTNLGIFAGVIRFCIICITNRDDKPWNICRCERRSRPRCSIPLRPRAHDLLITLIWWSGHDTSKYWNAKHGRPCKYPNKSNIEYE